jgi:hypothetical protein
MAAGLGFKTFVTGDVLTAGDTNGYLMQGVWVFADAAARDAAVTSPEEGNMCYLKDTSSGSTPDRLGIGTTGQVLTVNGGATAPEWATATSGSMTLLTTTTLSAAATITISDIDQTYTNLYVLATGINVTTGTYTLKIIPNNANSANYSSLQEETIAGNTANYISPGNAGHSASSTVNDYAITFFNYASATSLKPFMLVGIAKMASQVAPLGLSSLGAFNSTTAIYKAALLTKLGITAEEAALLLS